MISNYLRSARTTLLAVAMAASVATFAPSAPHAHANTSWVEAFACTQGISIYVVEDTAAYSAPRVAFGLRGGQMREAKRVGEVSGPAVPGGGMGSQYIYWSETELPANAQGIVTAFGQTNESYGTFTVSATCPALGSVRGSAFEDRNANGQRDAGEGVITSGWWKLSSGGDWYICGYAGSDGTFGPTVKPSTFTLQPIAPPGWRATTAPRTVLIRRLGDVSLNNDIGFVRDARAKGDVCSQYQPQQDPALATPALTRRSLADMLAAASGASNATFSTLLAAGRATGVLDTLTGGAPYTVFAPTDAAFARVPKRTLDRLIATPHSLAAVLRCHIAMTHVPPPNAGVTQRVRTLCGSTVLVQNAGSARRIAGRVSGAPIETDSGLVYPIDALLTLRGR